MTTFISLLNAGDKASLLRRDSLDKRRIVSIEAATFSAVHGSPFAYWLSKKFHDLFRDLEPFEANGRSARIGASTKNNSRYLRAWWEPTRFGLARDPWRDFAKGEPGQGFYADLVLLIPWGENPREIEAELLQKYPYLSNSADFVLHRENVYGWPGLTWPLRADRFKPRVMPAGCVFSDRGYAARVPMDDQLAALAVLNSTVFDYLYKTSLGRFEYPEFIVGILKRTPWAHPAESSEDLAARGYRVWSLMRSLDWDETSHAFVVPPILTCQDGSLAKRADVLTHRVAEVMHEVEELRRTIDEICFDLYGLAEDDRRAISSGFGIAHDPEAASVETNVGAPKTDGFSVSSAFVSWCVGVAFGRFDVRFATGEREWPLEPGPFDPLPICSAGMLTGEDGLLLAETPKHYPIEVSSMLVNEPGHPLDIGARVQSVFELTFGADVDQWWTDIGAALGKNHSDVRSWLSRGFLDHHLKAYSKSGRKAPLYWPLGTSSGSYLVWLYAHCSSGDSLFRVLNDLAAPKLALELRRLSELVTEGGPNPSASQRKAIDEQEKFVLELRDFVDELTAVAPLWHPNLNDGVVVVLAPLWPLFAHHKAWAKELRKHWDSLVAGEYDWTQSAMRLWPERVVLKCAEDRSLAIAHGLEDVFWVQDEKSLEKWHPRRNPTVSVDQLIADRTEPATKAALKDAVR